MSQQLREQLRERDDHLVSGWQKVLKDEDVYLVAREGDHTMAPFECD